MSPDFYRSKHASVSRWRALLWSILLLAPGAQASGWNDFVLDIGDGYNISRMSSLEVCIGKQHGPLILCGSRGSNVGPVDGYIVTRDHILSRTLGRKNVTYDDGYALEKVDTEVEHYFVIDKQSELLKGPFTWGEFQARPEVANFGKLDWERPTNPNAGPLLGLIAIGLSVILLVLAAPILLVALLVMWIKRRNTPQNTISDF